MDFAYGRLQTPEEARFYEALGWLSIFEGHYALARQQLEQAQRLVPDNLWVRLNLGWTYYLQGQQTEAFAVWLPFKILKHGMYRQALRREVEQLQALPTVRQGRPDFDPLMSLCVKGFLSQRVQCLNRPIMNSVEGSGLVL